MLYILLLSAVGQKTKASRDMFPELITMADANIKIENIVASTKLADSFDLNMIVEKFPSAEYNKKKFPGLVYRVSGPKAAFLIFTSGKVVCTGSKIVEDVNKVIGNLALKLREIDVPCYDKPDISIQNIVASADLQTVLNLNAIAVGLGLENIEYEPEIFPGLVYRVDDPKVVILIFSSGKLVVTGGKTPDDCARGVDVIHEQLDNMGLL